MKEISFNKFSILIDILKDYFQDKKEPLAVEINKFLVETNINHFFEKPGETLLDDWIDGQIVMQTLHISPRTLQTLRSNGTLPYSRIGGKLYYLKTDILKILSDNYKMQKKKNYGQD